MAYSEIARPEFSVRPRAGATVILPPHRYRVTMSTAEARKYATDVLTAAELAEAKAKDGNRP